MPALRLAVPLAVTLLACLGLTACQPGQFLAVKRNAETLDALSALHGSVDTAAEDPAKVLVVALDADGEKVRNYAPLDSGKRFLMRVEQAHTYQVVVMVDRNGNGRLDAGEPALLSPAPHTARQGAPALALSLRAGAAASANDALRHKLAALADTPRQELPLTVGQITGFDNPAFNHETGKRGLWAPADFLVEVGGGLYLLEPHDPKRIPVLFVHGAGGHPGEWQTLAQGLDRSRYQVWLAFYPSGARLERIADMLQAMVSSMRARTGLTQMIVVAHSMGGLVSRGMLQGIAAAEPGLRLRQFISISTPWSGHSAAKYGVEFAPATVPSWIDMQENSPFQQAIFARPLPAGTDYALLFSYAGSNGGDGVVSLASELRGEAQREARLVRGFNENHTSILRSAEVQQTLAAVLDGKDR
ncbi:esterase/lipase family protein [Uliginosibacterium sp. H1]|uniref:esterase/lipase family protein n=1 Tax=Uliginosibacterium sp. H1 TaxID=3114757 RepID=UPI002E1988D0|nr:alpha/beta fold hydrolase [Uliginosibacterium sp. H1]